MSKRPLSYVDTAWWRMDDPTNLMMITGVLVFSEPIDVERLKTTLRQRLAPFDRFRQRIVEPRRSLGRPGWVDDPAFDLDDHVKQITLVPPVDRAAFQDVVSELASTPLDPRKALWQVHLVDNFEGGCALICRFHHCIGDGFAMVHVLLSLTEAEPGAAPVAEESPAQPSRGRFLRRTRRMAGATYRLKRDVVREGWRVARHPSRAAELAHTGVEGAMAAARLVLRWPDPKTAFKGELAESKRVAWSDPIPLEEVKTVGRGLGGTVNDVLLAAMSGALRSYIQGRGEPVDGVDFRALVPVNLRPLDVEPGLGNRFGVVFLTLPVGVAEPLGRLRAVRRGMDSLKDSLEAPVSLGILNLFGLSPPRLQDIAVGIFGAKGTVVMTNVIGPRETIYLAGAPLESLMFWVPQSARLGIGVSILSYAGRVWLGVMADEGLVPDPGEITTRFQGEFDELLAQAQPSEGTPEVRQLLDELDRVDSKLEAAIEARMEAASQDAPPAPETGACQALTQVGRPCRNRAIEGSIYCWVHQRSGGV